MPGTENVEPARPTYEMDMKFEELLRRAHDVDQRRQSPTASTGQPATSGLSASEEHPRAPHSD